MSNLKSRNHDYNLDGVDIHIRNFPRADTHANLLPTAEAWLNYAKQAYGKGVVDFTATWGENGVVTYQVEMSNGAVQYGFACPKCRSLR